MAFCPARSVRATAVLRASFLGLSLLFGVLLPAMPASASAIPWRASYEAAEAEARASGRPLWVQFTGAWCGFCRMMESETFTRPEVVARGRDAFVPVRVDADLRPDLLARYGVSGLPTTLVADPAGRVVSRHEGFADAGTLLTLLDASRPAAAAPATTELALSGYDPVRLVKGQGLTTGRPSLAVRHGGKEFRFADADSRDAFRADPDRYLPVAHGCCPVSLVDQGAEVSGDPRFGVYYNGRLYLCADAAARDRFAAEPGRYADVRLADNAP